MIIPCSAKINWYLKILSRDSDGYHGIATIFQSVNLKDKLKITKRADDKIIFASDAKNIPLDERNLVLKAVNRVCDYIKKRPSGLSVFLEKHIPVQAGLGGASADAAAALLALNKLWNLKLTKKELMALAYELGADVPFNLVGGLAYAEGRGEKLRFYDRRSGSPLSRGQAPPLRLVIVKPAIGIPTKWAYEEFDRLNPAGPRRAVPLQDIKKLINAVKAADFETIKKYAVNDFEKVACKKHPRLKKIKEELINKGAAFSMLCGSGSAIFGLFKTKSAQDKAYKYFKKNRGLASSCKICEANFATRCLTLKERI